MVWFSARRRKTPRVTQGREQHTIWSLKCDLCQGDHNCAWGVTLQTRQKHKALVLQGF